MRERVFQEKRRERDNMLASLQGLQSLDMLLKCFDDICNVVKERLVTMMAVWSAVGFLELCPTATLLIAHIQMQADLTEIGVVLGLESRLNIYYARDVTAQRNFLFFIGGLLKNY